MENNELIKIIEVYTGIKIIQWKEDQTFYGFKNGTSNNFSLEIGSNLSEFYNFQISEESYHIKVYPHNFNI